MIQPDEPECELLLRERIAIKTLAIDFIMGLDHGTGAEEDWMESFRFQGISRLNAFQKDRAIEKIPGPRKPTVRTRKLTALTMQHVLVIDLVRRFLNPLKAPAKALAKATVRFETPPGQQAQVDWKYCGPLLGCRRKNLLHLCLRHGSLLFENALRRFSTSMKLPVLLDCHHRAFAFFGGCPASILYDNMKQERLSYCQWNPLSNAPFTIFLNGRCFDDLEDLNALGLHWCEPPSTSASTAPPVSAQWIFGQKRTWLPWFCCQLIVSRCRFRAASIPKPCGFPKKPLLGPA